jgi:hypothetical protein
MLGLEAMWLPPSVSWKMNREPCEWMIGFHRALEEIAIPPNSP